MQEIQERLAVGDFPGALAACQSAFSETATTEQVQLFAQVAVMNQRYDLSSTLYQDLVAKEVLLSEQDRMFYGISLDALDRTAEALQVFLEAFGEVPETLGPCRFMAALYMKEQLWAKALACYQHVTVLTDDAADAVAALILTYVRLADFKAAFDYLSPRLFKFSSVDLAYFVEQGILEPILQILESKRAWDDFLLFSKHLLTIDLSLDTRLLIAKTLMVFVNNNQYGETLLTLCREVILESDEPLDRLFLHLFVHNNYRRPEEILSVYNRLMATESTFMVPDMQIALQGFDLRKFEVVYYHAIYHGYSLKPFLEQLSQSLKPALPNLPAPTVNRTRAKGRVGIATYYFYPHSVMHFFSEIIKAFPEEIDVILISFNGKQAVRDYVAEEFLGPQFTFLDVSNDLYVERCQKILELECDLLLYPDIHMNKDSTVVAMNRLAPIQCCGMGHPTTTGMSSIDYYLSGAIFEPDNADDHYSETLVKIPGMPINYQMPAEPEPLTWVEYGFSETDSIYFCPMVPFKLMPEFDQVIPLIYDQDPNAQFIFVKFNGLEQIVQDRQKYYSDDLQARILWFDAVKFPKYLSLLQDADVILDTFPFSGGNTILQSFYVGTPVATLEHQYLRGRFTLGYYNLMGLGQYVHQSIDAYVSFAVRCATDPDFRADLSKTILSKKEVLFNRSEGVQSLVTFITDKISELRA